MRPYLLLLVMDVGVRFGVGVGVFFSLCSGHVQDAALEGLAPTERVRAGRCRDAEFGVGASGVGASGGLLARRHETATEPRDRPRDRPPTRHRQIQTQMQTQMQTETPALSSSFLFPPARRGWSAFEVIVGRTARGSSSRSFLVSSSPPSFLFPRLPFLSFLFRAMATLIYVAWRSRCGEERPTAEPAAGPAE